MIRLIYFVRNATFNWNKHENNCVFSEVECTNKYSMIIVIVILCPDLLAALNVAAEVNLVRQLSDVHLESVLDLVENLGVRLVTDEGDGQTLGTEPAGPGDSVEVGVSVLGHVIVEDNVDTLNIHS